MSLITWSLLPLAIALVAGGYWYMSLSEVARVIGIVAGVAWLGLYSFGQLEENRLESQPKTKRERFCSRHECIGDWQDAGGYRVRCSDGTYSFSGGISGSCSSHGGNGDNGRLW